jgi:Lysozyme like domain
MAQLSGLQVAQLAYSVGVPLDQLPTCVAIAWAESGLRTDATGYNPGPRPGTVASRDRGLWQINDYYHPDVSDQCAYDAVCNAQAMFRISRNGTNWQPWSTYNSGAYLQYLAAGQLAVHLMTEGAQSGGGPVGGIPLPAGAPNKFDGIAAYIRGGGGPIEATVRLVQDLTNIMTQQKHGPGHEPGPILGGYIK